MPSHKSWEHCFQNISFSGWGKKIPAPDPKMVVCHINEQKPQKTMTELFPAVAALLKHELKGALRDFILF